MSKKIFFTILYLALSFVCGKTLQGQTTTKTKLIDAKVQVTHAKFLGKTKPLKDLVPIGPVDPIKKANIRKNKKREVINFIGRDNSHMFSPKKNTEPDPVRQKDFGNGSNDSPEFILEPILNIEGLNANGSPSDPTGDIGQDFYIQAVNRTVFRVFDKQGVAVSNPIAMNTLWNSLGVGSSGDPIVLYDQEVDRWILTEFNSANQLLLAISETSNPIGSWMAYSFSTPNFPDYPKYSIWNNSYVVTTNEGGNQVLPSYFINRQDILNGVANPRIQRIEMPGISGAPSFFVGTPVDWSGNVPPASNTNPMILRLDDDVWSDNTTDQITIFSTEIDWNNGNNTVVTETNILTADFDTNACADAATNGLDCIPQMNGEGIDGIPQTIMNQPHYRNFGTHESLILNFLVNANTSTDIIAGIRWMEFRKLLGGDWEVYQEGTFSPDDGLHRFNGSIAMDGSGNIALAYNVSGSDAFPGLRYTGRRFFDPLGEMTVMEYNIIDGASSNPNDRWGDYAHMSIDPVNDRTFWFTSEYRGNNESLTRIVSYEFERDQNDIGVSFLISPTSSSFLNDTETVAIEVRNYGLAAQMVNNVGFIFENGTEILEDANVLLQPDSTFIHTFTSNTVDMSVIGDYDFKLFTTLASDQMIANDTLRITVSKLTRNDAGITAMTGFENSATCLDSFPVEFQLVNFGFDNLTSADILVTVNGAILTNFSWTGNVAMGESTSVPVMLSGFVNGGNAIVATTSNPNGQIDEDMTNDSFSRNINFIAAANSIDVVLNINTDNFPEELTWAILDSNNEIVSEGGPYPDQEGVLITESICLDTSFCYTFSIVDSYGDGICCGQGQGNYSLILPGGDELVTGNGEYGFGEMTDFCPGSGCILTADIDVSSESSSGANDGIIMIVAMNGVGPFTYSIDGGMTFQSSNIFDDLSSGDYSVTVKDGTGCETIIEVTVMINTSVSGIPFGVSVEVMPNPTNGNFRINIGGLDRSDVFLPFKIYDISGRLVQEGKLAKYDDTYTAEVSLVAYPSGTYLIRFVDKDLNLLVKIVRN